MPTGKIRRSTIDLLTSILDAPTEQEFMKVLQLAALKAGFERVLIGLQWQSAHGESRRRISSGYPEAWQRIYLDRAYIDIDPTVAHCLSSTDPLLWTEQLFAEADCLALLEEARGFGMGHGVSVPTHEGFGVKSMVCFARSQPIDGASVDSMQLIRSAKVIASCAHMGYRRLARDDMAFELTRPLSEQEKNCLGWTATGKTSWEIGKILRISESTAIFHIKNAMEKIGAKNRVQAVAVAFRMGLLH